MTGTLVTSAWASACAVCQDQTKMVCSASEDRTACGTGLFLVDAASALASATTRRCFLHFRILSHFLLSESMQTLGFLVLRYRTWTMLEASDP